MEVISIIPIANPFKTADDVTDQTPIDQIPDEYFQQQKPKFLSREADLKAIETGLLELACNEDVEQFILNEINHTVSSYDNHVIRAVFYAGISMYASPLNLALRCESGSGKSYGTTQTAAYLPPENVLYIGSQSPKVISHENGIRKDENGQLIDETKEPQKPQKSDYPNPSDYQAEIQMWKNRRKEYQELLDRSHYEVDLRNKTIIFLESVNVETFKMLKATMSHDNDWIDHKYVDDKGKVHVTRLVGAPVLIFNSLDTDYLEEFATRCLTATPNTTLEKIRASKKISTVKSNYPWRFNCDRFNKRLIQEYLRKVRDTITAGRIKAINPFENTDELMTSNMVRDMRDYNKFLELLPSIAYVHLFRRPVITLHNQRYVLPTVRDALVAKAVFEEIEETTKTGTEQRIISFFWDIVAKFHGATVEDLTDAYNQERKRKLSSRRIRDWLDRLVQIEWVDARQSEHTNDKGYVDKRFITYHPIKKRGDGAILDFAIDTQPKLEAGFRMWLKTVAEELTSPPTNYFTPD